VRIVFALWISIFLKVFRCIAHLKVDPFDPIGSKECP
jgi:hypothetical protein